MTDLLNALQSEFERNANVQIAREQKAYMRDQFEFYGIKTPTRRIIQKPFLVKEFLPPKKEVEQLIKTLWLKPEREYHHFAQELLQKYVKQFEEIDIDLIEYMVSHQSWWDTVDFIAANLIGPYFNMYLSKRDVIVKRWLSSNNMWLQRSAIIFQLKYKKDLDRDFLAYVINSMLGSKEFFINKAIGWALRDYSRVDPEWVMDFANRTDLAPLSRREALRLILKN